MTNKNSNLGENIANEIRNKIINRTYAPGDKLPNEFELAEEYQVCRYTVREAIKKLTAVGLVSVVRGRGTYVNQTQVASYFEPVVERLVLLDKNVDEIFQARIAIETKNAELAALNAGRQDIDEMHTIMQMMNEEYAKKDYSKHNELDIRLHECIARAGKNRILIDILRILYDMIAYTMEHMPTTEEKYTHSMQGHERIISCIENKQAREASEEMYNHLEFCRELYQTADDQKE